MNTYNHNRSYDERQKRMSALEIKQVPESQAKYVVITNRAAAGGCFEGRHYERHFFKHRATAIAWAQHYSDICDHVAGVFKMPEFIAKVDVR